MKKIRVRLHYECLPPESLVEDLFKELYLFF